MRTPTRTSFRRRASSAAVTAFCALAVLLALVPLGWILFFVLSQGLPALDLAFFTHLPKPVGEVGGGMANALAGTGVLLGLAALLAVPLGILCGMYVAEYRRTYLATAVRSAGSPSTRSIRAGSRSAALKTACSTDFGAPIVRAKSVPCPKGTSARAASLPDR